MLTCCRCKIEKDESEFSFQNESLNIRNRTCKDCFKSVRKAWYERHKARVIQHNINNKNKNIAWLAEYKKTIRCIECGEDHVACLEFHHTDPQAKEYNVAQLARGTYSISRIQKEIEKCVVLCSNCHRKLHYDEKHAPVAQLDRAQVS